MKRSVLALTALVFLSLSSEAALIQGDNAGGSLEKVKLSKTATVTTDDESVSLTAIGAGLRSKKVVFVNVKVYIGELFASEDFDKGNALASVKDQNHIGIKLHFLRDVDAGSVVNSFQEALTANNIDLKDPAIQTFLAAVVKGGEAKSGKALTILGSRTRGEATDGEDNSNAAETISYENTSGEVSHINGPAGFIEKVFSIWLGKPSDEGVARLKNTILK